MSSSVRLCNEFLTIIRGRPIGISCLPASVFWRLVIGVSSPRSEDPGAMSSRSLTSASVRFRSTKACKSRNCRELDANDVVIFSAYGAIDSLTSTMIHTPTAPMNSRNRGSAVSFLIAAVVPFSFSVGKGVLQLKNLTSSDFHRWRDAVAAASARKSHTALWKLGPRGGRPLDSRGGGGSDRRASRICKELR